MEQKPMTEVHDELGIVSVNKQIGTPGQTVGKLVFLVVIGSVMVIGLLMGMNQWHASRTAEAASEEQAAKVENKPAQVGPKRVFESDPLYQPHNISSDNWQAHISRSLPRARDGRAKAGAWNERDGEADASWAGNRRRKTTGNSTHESICGGRDSR